MDWLVRRFDDPDETTRFTKGKLDVVRVGDTTVGRATYEPGWKWSDHASDGPAFCDVEHVVMVIEGQNLVTMRDGRSFVMGPGDVVWVAPGHDSEVVGDEAYVSLHFEGTEDYGVKG